jgi:hypothetical protein
MTVTPIHPLYRRARIEPIPPCCDLCGEDATAADLRPNGRSLHRRGVCYLFNLAACAEHAVPGAVVSSYRLLNFYAPVMVLGEHAWPDGKVRLGLRVCLWRRDAAGGLWLVPAGLPFVREFPLGDPMPQADPAIRFARLGPADLPPQWLDPRRYFEP